MPCFYPDAIISLLILVFVHPGVFSELVVELTEIGGSGASGAVYFDIDEISTVRFELVGLEPNSVHGIHIHAGTDATSEDGSACGGHFNPFNVEHGCPTDAKLERHVGDMGSVTADSDGNVSKTKELDLLDSVSVLGQCVILHALEDDCGGASGNAGLRQAQGVIISSDSRVHDVPAPTSPGSVHTVMSPTILSPSPSTAHVPTPALPPPIRMSSPATEQVPAPLPAAHEESPEGMEFSERMETSEEMPSYGPTPSPSGEQTGPPTTAGDKFTRVNYLPRVPTTLPQVPTTLPQVQTTRFTLPTTRLQPRTFVTRAPPPPVTIRPNRPGQPISTKAASASATCVLTSFDCDIFEDSIGVKVSWTIEGDEIEILVSSEHEGWIGFGFSPTGAMINSNAVVGWVSDTGSHIGDYYLGGQSTYQLKETNNQQLICKTVQKQDGVTSIRFRRKLDVASIDPKVSAKNSTNVVMAVGPYSNVVPFQPHASDAKMASLFEFGKCVHVTSVGYDPWKLTHGALMSLSWGILIPAAIITVRFSSTQQQKKAIFRHQVLNGTGVIFTLAGFAIGILKIGTHTNLLHLIMGIVVAFICVLQPFNAYFRPRRATFFRKSTRRRHWELFHFWSGRLVLLAALANIFVGQTLLGYDQFLIFFLVFWAIVGLFIAVFTFKECQDRHKRSQVTVLDEIENIGLVGGDFEDVEITGLP